MIKAGYQRITPHSTPDAVAWWYVCEFEDGFVYARGGRCKTTREARHLYRFHCAESQRDHQAFVDRPLYKLSRDGGLEEVDYGPYGIDRRETVG